MTSMKAVTIREAQTQLGELIAEACRGELIVLTDGDKQVALQPRLASHLEEDSPELEAELLKAIDGPFTPYSPQEMQAIGERIIRQKQAK
jgi:antitoxin (DNA-binding transcriptional repressor) of toxin-antitoxin stability system